MMYEEEVKASHEINLQGEQLINRARLTGCVTDEEILHLLEREEGFHTLVHSIGFTVNGDRKNNQDVIIVLQSGDKQKDYNTETLHKIPCPANGTEILLKLDDYQVSKNDKTFGKITLEFNQLSDKARVSMKCYLNKGYHVPEVSTEPVDYRSERYKAMIRKSLLSKGNNYRLKTAIEKAENGEDITIAYIGGSITQGAGAMPIHTNCYAHKSYLKIKEMFGINGGENVHFIKAGLGGTPSELGVIRYERDVLRNGNVEPDIVIVEFGVNDADDETKGICYESLCLKILSNKNKPAVVLLFSVFVNDWNLQERLSPVGILL
ncbi:SGNH/GDSL hydrolase family protein [Gracilibacillus oryzae]|uniref:SGNH/GDSL hydrolase family protein n=1 Tax=Gracilibacillus oryzae TaxID=1672701 RepID=UPI001D186FBD|nr:SGNH/GDSL hydrolase family protein [Gracilibacillus oryzae]